MSNNKPLENFFARTGSRLTRLAQAMVQVDSVHGNETAVAKVVKKELDHFGISSKIIGDHRERGILLCDIGPQRGKTFMLNGHLDTVPFGDPGKWKYSPVSGKITGGKLYGRGSFDMKSSVAAAAFAGIALAKSGIRLPGRVRLVFNYDEETGQHSGIKEVIRRGIGADAAIVAEPMHDNSIFIGAKGVYRFELVTVGKTGHTGRRGAGINAVTKMAKLLLALESLVLKHKVTPGYSPPHLTPGTFIGGGQGINIYPDSCSATVDCRLTLGQTVPKVKAEIRAFLEREARKDPEIKFRINDICGVPPARLDLNHPLIGDAVSAVKTVFGRKPKLEIIGGVTDGNLLLAAGIPNLGFGVGGGGAHAENEYVNVADLTKTAHAFCLTALSFLTR